MNLQFPPSPQVAAGILTAVVGLGLFGIAVSPAPKSPPAPAMTSAGTPPASVAMAAPGAAVATVNGRAITEADLKLAETEIGGELAQIPDAAKRRVLTEYLIDTQLFADAAKTDGLAEGIDFETRLAYWRRRAMRDAYYDVKVTGGVTDAEAKSFYDQQIALIKPQEEVRARHILVESKEKAVEIADKLAKGGDFLALAKENSKDPGSKEQGGDLGFFGKGQMVPQFEETAFKMKIGEVSAPIETQFGWHILKLEEKRNKALPTFDQVKERIVGSLVNRKTQEATTKLRTAAKVEYVDPALKKMIEEEKAKEKAAEKAPKPAEKKP